METVEIEDTVYQDETDCFKDYERWLECHGKEGIDAWTLNIKN